jgi:hypothetical protein
VLLAHSRLQAQFDGSLLLTRLTTTAGEIKIRAITWTAADFQRKEQVIQTLIGDLKGVAEKLSTFVYDFGIKQGQNMNLVVEVKRASMADEAGPY